MKSLIYVVLLILAFWLGYSYGSNPKKTQANLKARVNHAIAVVTP